MAGMVLLAVPLLATGASFRGIITTLADVLLLLLPALVSFTLPLAAGAMVLLSLYAAGGLPSLRLLRRGEEGGGLGLLLLLATPLAAGRWLALAAPALEVGAVAEVAIGAGAVLIGEEVAAGRQASLGRTSTFPLELVLGGRARLEGRLLSLVACLLLALPPSPPLLLISLLGLSLALEANLGGLRLILGGVLSLPALGGRVTARPSLVGALPGGGELLPLGGLGLLLGACGLFPLLSLVAGLLLLWTGDLPSLRLLSVGALLSHPLKVEVLLGSTPLQADLLLPSTSVLLPGTSVILPSTLQQDLLLPAIASRSHPACDPVGPCSCCRFAPLERCSVAELNG